MVAAQLPGAGQEPRGVYEPRPRPRGPKGESGRRHPVCGNNGGRYRHRQRAYVSDQRSPRGSQPLRAHLEANGPGLMTSFTASIVTWTAPKGGQAPAARPRWNRRGTSTRATVRGCARLETSLRISRSRDFLASAILQSFQPRLRPILRARALLDIR